MMKVGTFVAAFSWSYYITGFSVGKLCLNSDEIRSHC